MNLKYLALTVLLAACKTGGSDSADTDVVDTDVVDTDVADTDVVTETCDDPTLENACDACFACAQADGGECFDVLETCNANPECAALIDCTNACVDSTCIQMCAQAHQDGVADLQAVASCVQGTCVESCPQD